jgi:hypothetical protein
MQLQTVLDEFFYSSIKKNNAGAQSIEAIIYLPSNPTRSMPGGARGPLAYDSNSSNPLAKCIVAIISSSLY